MSPARQFDNVTDEAADAPATSRLFRLASTALQVAMLTLACVLVGLYVFPLQ